MMPNDPNALSIRSKIWVVNGSGDVVFGLGRLKILEAVKRCGSIQGAARELGMSYRAVWGRIKATENRLGQNLLTRSIGGKAGGGSQLTPFALELMEKFYELNRLVTEASDRLFDKEGMSRFRGGVE